MFESPRGSFHGHLSCSWTHSTDAHQVVGQTGQAHQLVVTSNTPQSGLAQAPDCLAPTKELLDSFAHDLTCPIAGRFKRAFTEAGRVVTCIDGDMRSDTLCEQRFDKASRVITLIATNTLRAKTLAPLPGHQRQGRLRLSHTDRRSETHIADQAMAVIHQSVSGKAQLGLLTQRLAQQLRFRVRGAHMCVIAAPLALKIPIPTGVRSRTSAILRSERFHRGPGLNQRAIDTEVFIREQLKGARFAHHRVKEFQSHLFARQALAVLAERGGVERSFLKAHVQEPAEQNVVIERLAKEPITAYRVQCDQQLRLQQALRWNRRATNSAVEPIQYRADLLQRRIRVSFDRAQRMLDRHALIGREVTEHVRLRIYMTTHRSVSCSMCQKLNITTARKFNPFSAAC